MVSGEPACCDRFGQRLRPEQHLKLPRHLFQLTVDRSAPEPGVKWGYVRQPSRPFIYACKQSRYSNSVIKCSAIQWDENRKQWPSTLNLHLWSMFPHLSLAPCSAAWAHQACVLVCLFVFIHHCWGRVEGFWSGWGMLYKSRVGGAGGILAALDKKSPALAPRLSHQLPCPCLPYPAPHCDGWWYVSHYVYLHPQGVS